MTIAQRDITASQAKEFVSLAKFMMIGKGTSGAARMAKAAGAKAGPRVTGLLEAAGGGELSRDYLKAAVNVGSIGGWGSPLAVFENMATAFLGSLVGVSVFDTLWPFMVQAPLRTSVLAVSATISGGPIAEANVKPTSRLSLTASDLDVVKAAAFVAVSAELLRVGSPGASALVERELRSAITRATNSIFLPLLVPGVTIASSGVTALGVRQDLRTLLQNISNDGVNSKLFLIVSRTIAEAWSVLGDSAGGPAFPDARVDGGSIGGIQIVATDEAVAGEIILVDATQVAAGQEGLTLDTATETSLNLDTPGDSPVAAGTLMTSLWQNDLAAIKAERFIGAKVLRSDAVAKITGAAYSGNSPA